MVLTQALIDKLVAWQAAGNGACVYREGEEERIASLAELHSGMRVDIDVFKPNSPLITLTEANWFDNFEALILKKKIRRCKEELQAAEEQLAQIRTEVA